MGCAKKKKLRPTRQKVKTYPKRAARRERAIQRLRDSIEKKWLSEHLMQFKLEEMFALEKSACKKANMDINEKRRISQIHYLRNKPISTAQYPTLEDRRNAFKEAKRNMYKNY